MVALVLSGVPQGSVLGPILFLMYIDDIEKCLSGSTSGSFADDTRLSKTINCCEDHTILQEDLLKVIEWSKSNNMALHESKFELLTYNTPKKHLLQQLPNVPMVIIQYFIRPEYLSLKQCQRPWS